MKMKIWNYFALVLAASIAVYDVNGLTTASMSDGEYLGLSALLILFINIGFMPILKRISNANTLKENESLIWQKRRQIEIEGQQRTERN